MVITVRIFASYVRQRFDPSRAVRLRCSERIELDLSAQYQQVQSVIAEEAGIVVVKLLKKWYLTVDDELTIEKTFDINSKSNDQIYLKLHRCGRLLLSSKLSKQDYAHVLAAIAKESSKLELSILKKTADLRSFKLKVIMGHLVCIKDSHSSQELTDGLMHLVRKLFINCITGEFYTTSAGIKITKDQDLIVLCDWIANDCLGRFPRLHSKDIPSIRDAVERRAALVDCYYDLIVKPLLDLSTVEMTASSREVHRRRILTGVLWSCEQILAPNHQSQRTLDLY